MITPQELDHLAVLSRIKLSEEDKKSLTAEFTSILGYIDQIKKANVSLDSSGRVGAVKNVTRGDGPASTSPEDREGLLKEAPDRVGDFIAVKKIIS